MNNVRIQPTADMDEGVTIGDGSSIWHLAQVRHGAELGENVIVGRGAYIGEGVHVGNNCKIQNYALVYEPAHLEDGVFIGPAVVLTNDHFPRAINPDGTVKSASDWEPVGVTLKEGCSIGARTTCVAPVTVGRWATVAAGSVVVKDVPDYALVAGVPARRIKWVGRSGFPLVADGETADGKKKWLDEKTGDQFVEANEMLELVAEGDGTNTSVAEGATTATKEDSK